MIRCGTVHRNDPDPDLVRFLTEYGGRSLYGDPLFRLVWSGNRGEWRFRKWTDKDATGSIVRQTIEPRWTLLYRKPWERERFIVERLVSADAIGTPAEWRIMATDVVDGVVTEPLGGYPYRGEYRKCDTVDDGGGFIQPTKTYLKAVVDRVGKHRLTGAELLAFIEAETQRQEDAEMESLLGRIKDASRPYVITPHAYMTGLASPNYIG